MSFIWMGDGWDFCWILDSTVENSDERTAITI